MKIKILMSALMLAAVILSGCGPAVEPTPEGTPPAIQTAEAMMNEAETVMQNAVQMMLTAEVIITAEANRLLTPTATPSPTPTPTPLATSTPFPTSTGVVLCDTAAFVSDVTVPDGTVFAPGASFTKTWRLRNTGSCIWSAAYRVVFSSGEQMAAISPVNLTSVNILPGSTVDISLNMTAPLVPGTYKGLWLLSNASGVRFGLDGYDAPFYVEIKVQEPAAP